MVKHDKNKKEMFKAYLSRKKGEKAYSFEEWDKNVFGGEGEKAEGRGPENEKAEAVKKLVKGLNIKPLISEEEVKKIVSEKDPKKQKEALTKTLKSSGKAVKENSFTNSISELLKTYGRSFKNAPKNIKKIFSKKKLSKTEKDELANAALIIAGVAFMAIGVGHIFSDEMTNRASQRVGRHALRKLMTAGIVGAVAVSAAGSHKKPPLKKASLTAPKEGEELTFLIKLVQVSLGKELSEMKEEDIDKIVSQIRKSQEKPSAKKVASLWLIKELG